MQATLKYKPTGKIKQIPLKIKKLEYYNELVLCDSWGYDNGQPSDLNNPDNWELIELNDSNLRAQVVKHVKELLRRTSIKCRPLEYEDAEIYYDVTEREARANIAVVRHLKHLFKIKDEELERFDFSKFTTETLE